MFGDGWKFAKLADGTKLNSTIIDTSKWENVTIPHTWNAVDGCDGYANSVVESDGTVGAKDRNENSYYRGLGGYVKEYTFNPDQYLGKKIYIEFEGANTVTTLYVNGKQVGEPHKGGYAAFRYDITDYVTLNQKNMIVVTVDNSRTTDIAPLDGEGDFTKFGGIYRDVSIIAVDKVHIDLMDYGSDGVYVSTDNVSAESADTNIKVNVTNDTNQAQSVVVKAELFDAEGNSVASNEQSVEIDLASTSVVAISIPVNKPHLWCGVYDPYLYSCKITVISGSFTDSKSVSIGYRYFSVNNDNGFLLNGKTYNVFGVNYHQDSYENGWAMTNSERDRDFNIMREMGVTAVRMAHYQHDQYEYAICDRKGLLVYTEIPLINRSMLDNQQMTGSFSDNIKQQLMEMIKQNYNHPSIIFWGISNELYDVDKDTNQLYQELCDMTDKEDPSRITIYADNVVSDQTRSRSAKTEAVGYNKYEGWYSGDMCDLADWLATSLANDARPSCMSEYGAGAAVTQHMDNVQIKDITPNGSKHYEEYQSIFHEVTWAIIYNSKVWGSFIWCMFDFASDTRIEGDTQGQNDKGLVTRDRKTYKDAFYFYKSLWNPDYMVYITDKRFTERSQTVPEVKVYSNAAQVELFVNGKSYGLITQAYLQNDYKTIYKWNNITLDKGNNMIKAVATYYNGSTGTDTITWIVK